VSILLNARGPRRWLCIVALLGACATAPTAPPLPIDALAPALTTKVFENGLTVVAIPKPGSGLIGASAFVTTGGRTETAEFAGALHFIEHLVFKGGTPRLPPTLFRKRISTFGDESGGWTWDDEIQFGFEVPKRSYAEALDLFAEALMELQWSDPWFEEERKVVLQEIATTVENGWTRLWQAFDAAMFTRHPYGRAVIGDAKTVLAMKRPDLERYYRERFTPNHMVIVLAGEVGPIQIEEAGKRFARYPKGPASFELEGVTEAPITEPRTVTIHQKGAPTAKVILGVRTPGARHPDTAALLLLGALLGSPTEGLPAMLERESGWLTDFGADHGVMVDYGQLTVRFEAPTGRAQTIVDGVIAWLGQVSDRGFSREAVDAAARRLVVDRARSWERVGDLAQIYGISIGRMGPERAAALTREVLALTPDDIEAVADEYLVPSALVTAILLPEGQVAGSDGTLPEQPDPEDPPDLAVLEPTPDAIPLSYRQDGQTASLSRFRFDTGLTLIVRQAPGAALVTTTAYVLGGQWVEDPAQAGIALLTSRLLTAGTQRLGVRQWDRLASDRSLEIATAISGDDRSNIARNAHSRDGSTLSMSGTTADVPLLVALLGEALFRPRFPTVEVDKARQALLAEIAALDEDDLERTKQRFYELAYPNHPYGRPTIGTKQTVRGLGATDVAAFHRRAFAPDRIVVSVVGDVDPAAVAAMVSSSWAGALPPPAGPFPECVDPQPRSEGQRAVDSDLERPLYCINLGAPAVAAAHEDASAIELVMAMARGRHFYKYVYELGVSYRSWIRFWPHLAASPWILENDLDKTRFEELVGLIEDDLADYAEGTFGPEDLRVAQDRLAIQVSLDAQRGRETAFQIAWGTALGKPWDALEREVAALRKVTPMDITRVAKQLFGGEPRYKVLSR
jgi:zinc protease